MPVLHGKLVEVFDVGASGAGHALDLRIFLFDHVVFVGGVGAAAVA